MDSQKLPGRHFVPSCLDTPPRGSMSPLDSNSRESASSTGNYTGPASTFGSNVSRPTNSQIQEICGMLKVKTSMLALGACERVKKLARQYPKEVINSAIMAELIHIVVDGPGTPLAGAAMSALCTIAMWTDGRHKICVMGGVPPVVKLVARADMNKPNTEKGVSLLMNLAADNQNRKVIREAGGVEALVAVMAIAPLDTVMESVIGALHNVMLTDGKAKQRAVDANIAAPIARVLSARLQEHHLVTVRIRMLVTDLLRVPDIQERIHKAAEENGFKLPGMPGYVPPTPQKVVRPPATPEKKLNDDTIEEEEGAEGEQDEESEEGGGSEGSSERDDNDDAENVVTQDDD